VKLTDDVKQRKQKYFKQYRTAKQKLTNKENLVRFLHRGKPLHWLKNERSSYLSTVAARRNEIDALLSNEENISLVKEKLPGFLAAYEAFKEADLAYSSNLQDEVSFARCQEQFNFESLRADDFCKRVQEWTRRF